jgi:hypothetical protein
MLAFAEEPRPADTLFSVGDADLRVAQLDDVGSYVTTLVLDALASEGLALHALGPVEPSDVRVAKTASRSVLGHMNEMTFEAKHFIARDGGLPNTDRAAVNRRLRRDFIGAATTTSCHSSSPPDAQADARPSNTACGRTRGPPTR